MMLPLQSHGGFEVTLTSHWRTTRQTRGFLRTRRTTVDSYNVAALPSTCVQKRAEIWEDGGKKVGGSGT
ncbi:hypothetical protein B0T17DRAFT_513398 [Bombardia bombarda]|uniref:Uncharacterized protein n=1 Tax=Bombardia bombarda TaxID=252184 RepID=A0AA39XI55_9PEZI|nr:hypothetical protein B0T17DRAFT_513398 [Bombardia bombarda]